MADDSFPKIHIDFVANGDFVHLRTDSGDEMAHVIEGLEENAEAIFKGVGNVKQAALAVGVFSGNATQQSGGGNASQSATQGRSAAATPPGVQPNCQRCGGATKDLRGKRDKNGNAYKNRYYCSNFSCKGPGWGDWIE